MNFSSFFAEFHGDKPSREGLILIYSTAILGGSLLLFYASLQELNWWWWQYLIFALLAFDILGGAVANMTESTNRYYREKGWRSSLIFLALHIVHPSLLILLGLDWLSMLALFAYVFLGGILIIAQDGKAYQKPLAAGLVVMGIILHSILWQMPPVLLWFVPVFLLKLLGAFSVRHYLVTS